MVPSSVRDGCAHKANSALPESTVTSGVYKAVRAEDMQNREGLSGPSLETWESTTSEPGIDVSFHNKSVK